MAYCGNCGVQIQDTVNFCPNCGAAMNNTTAAGTQNSSYTGAAKTAATIAGTAVGVSLLSRLFRRRCRPPMPPHGGMMGGPMRGPGGHRGGPHGGPRGGFGGPHGGHGPGR